MAMVEAATVMRASAALRQEAGRQQAKRVTELDFDALARAVVQALKDKPATSPIDPEGDGLETRELNATNDL